MGRSTTILIAQKYLPDDDLRLMDDVCRYFADPRYITMDGAPLFIVYRPQQLAELSQEGRGLEAACRGEWVF